MTRRLTDAAAIRAALESADLVPPPRAGIGAALDLRRAMARFSGPDDHRARRADVEAAIAAVDADDAAERAAQHTARRIDHAATAHTAIDAVELARFVPAASLAGALGVPDAHLADVVRDVGAVAAVIGRGDEPDPASDAATVRLLDRFDAHPGGAVAAVSLLYQCLDATAALVLTTLDAAEAPFDRVPAVPRTIRVSIADARDDYALEIGAAGLEFGAGVHACPGRQLAEGIADAITAALATTPLRVDASSIERDRDGRPTAMHLQPVD